jgi:catechol 2,3-dioxygenase-like lactoylglutathione lyase family enzyme
VESFAFRDDPDGFLMEVVQGSGAGIVLTAADPDEKLRFYRELLGFDLQRGEWERVLSAAHAPVSVRRSIGRVPGTDVPFEIREYQGLHQRRFYPSTMGQDGVAWIQLLVRDLDALMRVFIAERVLIVSTGLQPVVVDDGTRRVVVRDPDGVFVELIERTTDNRGER